MKPLVYIIILNWNGWQDTVNCLRSLREITYPNYHILLIDNGSTDESVKEITPHLNSTIHFTCNRENAGFTRGSNQGIQYAMEQGAEFVLLLNNDTRVRPDFLDYMVSCPSNPDVGMVQPLMLRMNNPWMIDSTGHIIRWGLVEDRGSGEDFQGQYRDAHDLIGCSGAAGLYRVSMFRRIGLFDYRYTNGYEDSEFSWRAWLAGWKTAYAPCAIVDHRRSTSLLKRLENEDGFRKEQYRLSAHPCKTHGTMMQKISFVTKMGYMGIKSYTGHMLGRNKVGAEMYFTAMMEMLR
jgi:GT2 family glycosyltransferase